MFTRILLSPDDNASAGAPSGDSPESAKVVKKTPALKSPREVDLEKKLSKVEDRVGSLESVVDGINSFLGEALPNPPKPGKPSSVPATVPVKSILDEIDSFLGGAD